MKGIKLKKNKDMSFFSECLTFNNPKYVYIPLVNRNNRDFKICVSVGDSVCVGTKVAFMENKYYLPLFSSVSGKVIEFVDKIYLDGEKVKCIVIENDFKENYNKEHKEYNFDISKDQFINILKNCGIIGLGGSGFPTYLKYDNQYSINTLLINGVECEPFITADFAVMNLKLDDILFTIDKMISILGAEKAVFAIKESNYKIKNLIKEKISKYEKISLFCVKDLYPMGWEKELIKNIFSIDYEFFPIEKGIVVNNVSTIFSIYEAIKFHKNLTNRIITVTGLGVKKTCNINVKVGSLASDIINYLGGYTKIKNIKLVAGGPMMGRAIISDDLVVTPNLNCLLLIEKVSFDTTIACMRCGKCVEKCPCNLSPVLIKDNIDNIEKLRSLHPERCIECGLCTFVCPSKIDVRKYVKNAKKKVR